MTALVAAPWPQKTQAALRDGEAELARLVAQAHTTRRPQHLLADDGTVILTVTVPNTACARRCMLPVQPRTYRGD